jgi:hypothetical protein
MRTDRRTEGQPEIKKLNVAFRNFARAPSNQSVNSIQGEYRCFFLDLYKPHRYIERRATPYDNVRRTKDMELDGPETSENAAHYGTVYTHGLVTAPGLHNPPSNQETCCTVVTCPYRPVPHKSDQRQNFGQLHPIC